MRHNARRKHREAVGYKREREIAPFTMQSRWYSTREQRQDAIGSLRAMGASDITKTTRSGEKGLEFGIIFNKPGASE